MLSLKQMLTESEAEAIDLPFVEWPDSLKAKTPDWAQTLVAAEDAKASQVK